MGRGKAGGERGRDRGRCDAVLHCSALAVRVPTSVGTAFLSSMVMNAGLGASYARSLMVRPTFFFCGMRFKYSF